MTIFVEPGTAIDERSYRVIANLLAVMIDRAGGEATITRADVENMAGMALVDDVGPDGNTVHLRITYASKT